jgi:hypothetical protein
VELLEKNKLVIQQKFCPEDPKFIEEIIEKIKAKKDEFKSPRLEINTFDY